MTERTPEIPADAPEKHLKALLDVFKKAARCRQVLEMLFEHHPNPVSVPDLAIGLGLSLACDYRENHMSTVRDAVSELRKKLRAYENQHPESWVSFEVITDDGYRLEMRTRPQQKKIQVPLIFENRHGHWLEELLQAESNTILFASISSRHTLDRIRPWFDEPGLIKTQHFRVLTWWPPADTLQSFSEHVGENVMRMQRNIESAWEGWRELQESKEYVEVYRYTSAPTMQAIRNDRYIKLELLPYNRKGACFHECGSTENRPGLILDATDPATAAGSQFFGNAFEDLWVTAMLAARPEDIHPKWSDRRIERLSKLGLLR